MGRGSNVLKIGFENHLRNRLTVFSRYVPLQPGAHNNSLIAGIVITPWVKRVKTRIPDAHSPGFNIKTPGTGLGRVTEGAVVTNFNPALPSIIVCAWEVQFWQMLSHVELGSTCNHL